MIKYKIELSRKVQKFLSKADKNIIISFREKLEIMQYDPKNPSLDIKIYKNSWPNNYRLRI